MLNHSAVIVAHLTDIKKTFCEQVILNSNTRLVTETQRDIYNS